MVVFISCITLFYQVSAQQLEVQSVTNGHAILASSQNGLAVQGLGLGIGIGVRGVGENNVGVDGFSTQSYGVRGQSSQHHGAYFKGANGFASIVLGGSNYIAGDDDGVIMSDPFYTGSDIILVSNDAVVVKLDNDNNEAGQFEIRRGNNDVVFSVDESGNVKLNGTTIHSSDRNKKTNFQAVATADILTKLCAIPIQKWNYKDGTMTHIGPMAQDFYAAYKIGLDDKTICAVDADGILMAAVQALANENQILKRQLLGLEQKMNRILQHINAYSE